MGIETNLILPRPLLLVLKYQKRRPLHFRLKGRWLVFLIFIQILVEHIGDPDQAPRFV